MKRVWVLWVLIGIVLWNVLSFYGRGTRSYARFSSLRSFMAFPNTTTTRPSSAASITTPSLDETISKVELTSTSTLPPSPLPSSLPLVIPTVPIPDTLPARWYGQNRAFNHSIWKIFPVPRLVNFPENGKYVKAALEAKKSGTFEDRVFHIGQQGYSLNGAQFPSNCPFKCTFGSDQDAIMVGNPGSCDTRKLSFVFGLESSAHSWWAQDGTYQSCAFTMRSNLDATIPMLGQLKSFLPVDLETGRLPYASLPWIPYTVKSQRQWMTAMISNCESTRLQLFSKLGELGVSTAQYGGCGHASKGEEIPWQQLDPVQTGILKQLMSGDKFFQKEALIAPSLFHFAAENSLCDFYHTEKLFGALKAGTVPIYFGARTIYPYLPEKSVLFVYDYDNVFELAEHIKKLATNEDLYNEYLAWRKKPLAEPLLDLLTVGRGERSDQWQCDVCTLVATTPLGRYEQAYDDCEAFPLAEFLTPGFKLTEHVKKMQKDKPGGRRW